MEYFLLFYELPHLNQAGSGVVVSYIIIVRLHLPLWASVSIYSKWSFWNKWLGRSAEMLKFYESMKTHISLFSKYLSSKEISVAYKWAFLQTKKIKFDFLLYVLYLYGHMCFCNIYAFVFKSVSECYDLVVCVPLPRNSNIGNLMPNLMVLGGGSLGGD